MKGRKGRKKRRKRRKRRRRRRHGGRTRGRGRRKGRGRGRRKKEEGGRGMTCESFIFHLIPLCAVCTFHLLFAEITFIAINSK